MSQFEGGAPASSISRRGGGSLEALSGGGITGSLDAPGLAILPPVDPGVALAAQFSQAIGETTQTANSIAVRIRAKEIQDREAYAIDKGHGVEVAREKLPEMLQKVQNGEMVPPPGLDAEEWARQVADTLAADQSPGFREGYHRALVPALLNAWTVRSDAVDKKATADINQSIFAGAETATTAADIQAHIGEYKRINRDTSEQEAAITVAGRVAEHAARSGNRSLLDAAIEAGNLQTRDPDTVRAAEAIYDAKQKQLITEEDVAGRQEFASRVERGDSPAVLKDWLGSSDASRMDPSTRLQMRDHIAGIEAKKLADTQKIGTNSLSANVYLGIWPTDKSGNPDPVAAVQEIGSRMLLPDTDPRHVPADTGHTLINAVEKAVNTDVRSAIVENAMSTRGPVPVLTPDDSNAMLSALGRRGIVTGAPKGEGQFVLTGIADPLAFASQASRFNMVPDKAEAWIRQGATSQDPAQATPALATYAAIYTQDPTLAASIQLPPEAAARARYVVSRLENGDPSWKTDNGTLNTIVSKLATTAIKIDPAIAALDQKQVLGTVLFKDPLIATTQGATFESSVAAQITKDLKSRLGDQVGISPKVIPAQLFDDYKRNLVDEFKIQRSLTTDDAQAAENAKKWAMQRTIADNPPSTWGGVTRFQSKGQPVIDAPVADALRGEIKKSIDSDTASTLWTRYVPVYTKQTASGRPGFMFMPTDGSGAPFTAGGGRSLVVSLPDSHDEASAAAKQVAAKEHAREMIRGETSKILQKMSQMRAVPTAPLTSFPAFSD